MLATIELDSTPHTKEGVHGTKANPSRPRTFASLYFGSTNKVHNSFRFHVLELILPRSTTTCILQFHLLYLFCNNFDPMFFFLCRFNSLGPINCCCYSVAGKLRFRFVLLIFFSRKPFLSLRIFFFFAKRENHKILSPAESHFRTSQSLLSHRLKLKVVFYCGEICLQTEFVQFLHWFPTN